MSRKTLLTLCLATTLGTLGAGCNMFNKDDDHDARKSGSSRATETTITAADVPANVRAAFDRDHPQATINSVVQETYPDGKVHYEFNYTTRGGKKESVELNARGEKAHAD